MWVDLFIGAVLLFIIVMGAVLVGQLFIAVPWVPTPRKVVRTVLREMDLRPGQVFYDLGAGDARSLIEAKKMQPELRLIGCEIAPAVFAWGKLRLLLSGTRADFHFRSAFTTDLHDADALFLYLFPGMLGKLVPKFDAELRPGTRVVSVVFPIPSRTPVREIPLDFWKKGRRAFVYEWGG